MKGAKRAPAPAVSCFDIPSPYTAFPLVFATSGYFDAAHEEGAHTCPMPQDRHCDAWATRWHGDARRNTRLVLFPHMLTAVDEPGSGRRRLVHLKPRVFMQIREKRLWLRPRFTWIEIDSDAAQSLASELVCAVGALHEGESE